MKGTQVGDTVDIIPNENIICITDNRFKVIHISKKEPKIGIQLNQMSPVIYINSNFIKSL